MYICMTTNGSRLPELVTPDEKLKPCLHSETVYPCGREVRRIQKCRSNCAVKKAVGKCVIPTEGIFAVVMREGAIRAGDNIEILEAKA